MSKPDVNHGIISTNISAKSVAVGRNATAYTSTRQDSAAVEIQSLNELILAAIRNNTVDQCTGDEAKRNIDHAAASVARGDSISAISSIEKIVGIFKSLADTVSSTGNIVEVASKIIGRL